MLPRCSSPPAEGILTVPAALLLIPPDSSDADSDVLADYVLALIKAEEPDDQVRTNCLENLQDFLQDRTWETSTSPPRPCRIVANELDNL
jgi:hypothetical protein